MVIKKGDYCENIEAEYVKPFELEEYVQKKGSFVVLFDFV